MIQVNVLTSPRIITIPEEAGTSITIQSLVNQIRVWEDDQVNLVYPRLLSAAGKEDLGGDVFVGITAKLENAKVKFAYRNTPTVCDISGGNLVAIDTDGISMFPIEYTENITVTYAKSSSATLVQDADIDVIKTDVGLIKKIESGRWKIINNQMIFYDNDTPLITFDLKDKSGQPTEADVFERVPVE